ncbi:hypothetical protein KCU99_g1900, partial [Aureobasidium melanogenum]
MPPETPTSNSFRARSTSTSARTATCQVSGPTLDMNGLDASDPQGQPTTSSRKRQRFESQASKSDGSRKRLKVNFNRRSTQHTPEDRSNLEDNGDHNIDREKPESEDLETKSYLELKRMYAKAELRDQYGDTLLPAIYKARFKHSSLELLQSIDRSKVPDQFHAILDDTIEHKTQTAALEALDDHMSELWGAEWDQLYDSFKDKPFNELRAMFNHPTTKNQSPSYKRILRDAAWTAKLKEATFEQLWNMTRDSIPRSCRSIYDRQLRLKDFAFDLSEVDLSDDALSDVDLGDFDLDDFDVEPESAQLQ